MVMEAMLAALADARADGSMALDIVRDTGFSIANTPDEAAGDLLRFLEQDEHAWRAATKSTSGT